MTAPDPTCDVRIAISTGGGDAPGLNAVIRAVTIAACRRGWEVFGLRHGYRSLFRDADPMIRLTEDTVRHITNQGGTILGAVSVGDPFGGEPPINVARRATDLGLDAVVAIGGDGSLQIAYTLSLCGLPVIGIPKTIDNDVHGTQQTFGFDTAVHNATDLIDKIHPTAQAHERVFVVEVMGRDAGWIALHAGVAGNADVILLPEIPFDPGAVVAHILGRYESGQRYAVVVAAEAATPVDEAEIPNLENGGGIADYLCRLIHTSTGLDTRSLVCGHSQRGGVPTTFDRLLALRLGTAAVDAIEQRQTGVMLAWDPPDLTAVPLELVAGQARLVDPRCATVRTACQLGITFGVRAIATPNIEASFR